MMANAIGAKYLIDMFYMVGGNYKKVCIAREYKTSINIM